MVCPYQNIAVKLLITSVTYGGVIKFVKANFQNNCHSESHFPEYHFDTNVSSN